MAILISRFIVGMNAPRHIGTFEIEMIALNHSIPDQPLAIRSAAGTIVHTGDWKFDNAPVLGTDTDAKRLRAVGDAGVLAMVGDSTNAMINGRTGSESEAQQGLTEAIAEQAGRWLLPVCGNMARIHSICMAAQANGRSVAIAGRASIGQFQRR